MLYDRWLYDSIVLYDVRREDVFSQQRISNLDLKQSEKQGFDMHKVHVDRHICSDHFCLSPVQVTIVH